MGFVGIPLYHMRGIINRRGAIQERVIQVIHNQRTAKPDLHPFDVYTDILAVLHKDWMVDNRNLFNDERRRAWNRVNGMDEGTWCPVCDYHMGGPLGGIGSIKWGRQKYLDHARTCPLWELMDVELDFAPEVEFNERFRFRNP